VTVKFRVLGPLEAHHDDEPLGLGGAKQRALLAILLLHANEVVSSDRLIDELWGAKTPKTAAKSLQVLISQLRKVLEPGRARGESGRLLVTRSPGYLLHIEPEQLDLEHFQRLASEGREALAAGDPQRAARTLQDALGLWRGPPLADLAYADFAQREISRLEELRLAALEDRIQADLQSGRHAEVIGELERLVAEEPLREGPRALLMLALYRSGRQAEALKAYRDARRALTDELGIEPSRELRELEQAILTQDASLDLVPISTEPDDDADAERGVFVGREAELHELSSALDGAIAGRGRLVLIVGEPGIGKSRLAEEVSREARARGARVLFGRCWEAGGAPAYWPWVQALRAYIERSEPEPLRSQLAAGAAEVAQIVPELREQFPDLPASSLEGESTRFRLFDSLARFLRNAAAARPLLLVLEDLHAADEPSLLLLRFLAGELAGSHILVVGTYRDVDPTVRDPLASTLAELAREQVTHRIELTGLTEADVERYIELSAEAVPPADLVAAIHAETEGNPLFVGEVVRLLAAETSLADVDAGALWALGIPQGVREVIGRRLGRLSDECTRLLTLASLLGREFGLGALERLSELPPEAVLGVLDEAMAERVLASVPGPRGRLRFAHALIRETLYDGLTTPRRVQLHRRAGEALEALYGEDSEPHLAELAHHFFEAAPGGDVDKALAYAQRAGDRALGLLAYEEAARLYELGLEALEMTQRVDPSARCELLLSLGEALAKAGSTAVAEDTFLAAADLARTSGLSQQFARAALGYGGRFYFARAGTDDRLVPLLNEALATLGEEESVLRVRLLARLAGALRDQPVLEPRSSMARQAVAIARRLDDPETLLYALVSLFWATSGPEIEEPLAIAEEVSRLAKERGGSEQAVQARWCQYVSWMTLGETARADAVADEYRALADEVKEPTQQWYSLVRRSILALFTGEFSEAEQLADGALALGRRAQSWDAGFSHRVVMFFLRREQGRLEEIEDLIRRSVAEYAGYRSFRCLVILLECELGREDEARRAFEEVAAKEFAALPRDIEWLFCLSILAEVAAYLHDRDHTSVLYRLLLPYARLNAVAAGEVAVGSVARYLGILASTTSRWDEGTRHFEDALEMNGRMGARPWLAHTQQDFARMLLARDAAGDKEKAQLLLTQALTTYEELGMHRAAASASALTLDAGLAAR
jgi:DNA-binding SARP family transcriptional activator